MSFYPIEVLWDVNKVEDRDVNGNTLFMGKMLRIIIIQALKFDFIVGTILRFQQKGKICLGVGYVKLWVNKEKRQFPHYSKLVQKKKMETFRRQILINIHFIKQHKRLDCNQT